MIFRGKLEGHDAWCKRRFHLCLKCTCEKPRPVPAEQVKEGTRDE